MTLSHYLLISGILFCTGLFGVLIRRNLLVIFMCLEMMLAAASLSLVAFARFRLTAGLPAIDAQMLVFFVITVAAAEVGVGLAMVLLIYRNRKSIALDELSEMKG